MLSLGKANTKAGSVWGVCALISPSELVAKCEAFIVATDNPIGWGERAAEVKVAIFMEESELSISGAGVSALAALALPDEKISKRSLHKRLVFASSRCIFWT